MYMVVSICLPIGLSFNIFEKGDDFPFREGKGVLR